MSQTRDQKCFTISEVTADWHELMIPQRTMQPSVAHISEQLDPWFAASRHTTAQSATRGLHPVTCKHCTVWNGFYQTILRRNLYNCCVFLQWKWFTHIYSVFHWISVLSATINKATSVQKIVWFLLVPVSEPRWTQMTILWMAENTWASMKA